eukprot:SAG31_NODE_9541_length_1260_cov_7.613264_1_plen_92_part_00
MYHGTDLYARILHVVRFDGYRIYRDLLYLEELDSGGDSSVMGICFLFIDPLNGKASALLPRDTLSKKRAATVMKEGRRQKPWGQRTTGRES